MLAEAEHVTVSRREYLWEATIGDEMIGLQIEKGNCYGFNATAYRIWQLLEKPSTLAEICDALRTEYAVDPAKCEQEVRRMFHELAQDGIVSLSVGS